MFKRRVRFDGSTTLVQVGPNCCADDSCLPKDKSAFRMLLSQVRWSVNHVKPQFSLREQDCDEWSVSKDVMSRRACLADVVVVNTFHVSFTRSVEKGASIYTMIEFHSIVHRMIEEVRGRQNQQFWQTQLLKGVLDWRSRRDVLNMIVLDAKSLVDHAQTRCGFPRNPKTLLVMPMTDVFPLSLEGGNYAQHRKHQRQQRHRMKENREPSVIVLLLLRMCKDQVDM